jgi:transcriptional regulator with XRE-family HTH domain
MQMETFGTKLRTQREQQHITLETIAEQTKIKLSLLQGLERDDMSRWPQGIFRRAYVRAYAKAIRLDPDVVLRQFLEIYPEPVEPAREEDRHPTRLGYLFSRLRRGDVSEPPKPFKDGALEVAGSAETRRPERSADRVEVAESGLLGQLNAVAALCTKLARASEQAEVATTLRDTARILKATGVILWLWDPRCNMLVSALSHGYPDQTLAQLPTVPYDADNAIASVFRSVEAQVVSGNDGATGAVVVPLMTPNGCPGVLAIELADGRERREVIRAFALILAAQLATLIAVSEEEAAPADLNVFDDSHHSGALPDG